MSHNIQNIYKDNIAMSREDFIEGDCLMDKDFEQWKWRIKIRPLHWYCSKSGHKESFVYHDGKEFLVKMVEVNRSGKDKFHHNLKEMRSMGNHSEQYAKDCAENWVMGII